MTRLGSLLRLLWKLLSSAFIKGSIRRIFSLFDYLQRRFSMKKAFNVKPSSSVSHLQPNHGVNFPISNAIYPSSRPHLRAVEPNLSHIQNGEQHTTSTKGYHTTSDFPAPHGSRSYQDIHNLLTKVQNGMPIISGSVSGRQISLLSLSLPNDGHALDVASVPVFSSPHNYQRPDSGEPQLVKVSRASSAAPSVDNVAPPAGEIAPPDDSGEPSSQQPRTMVPISAADIRRWGRGVVVYVLLVQILHDNFSSDIHTSVLYSPTDRNYCVVGPLEFDFLEWVFVGSHSATTFNAIILQRCATIGLGLIYTSWRRSILLSPRKGDVPSTLILN